MKGAAPVRAAPLAAATAAPALRTVTRSFLRLAAGEVVAAGIAFATTVYLARTLEAAAYGALGVALALLAYGATVTDGGMDAFGPRVVAAEPGRIGSLVPGVLVVRLLVAALLAGGFAVVGVAALPQPEGGILTVAALSLFAVAANTRWVHLGLDRAGSVATARIVGESMQLGLVFVLVRGPHDVLGAPLASVGGASVAALWLAATLRRRLSGTPLRIEWATAQHLLREARPLMLAPLLGMAIYNSDLLLVRLFRDRDEAGRYLAAYALINVLGLLGGALRGSLVPALSRLSASAEQHTLERAVALRMGSVGVVVAGGGTVLAPFFVRLVFGSAYATSIPLLQILLWSIPALWLRSVWQAALIARGRQRAVLRLTASTAVLSVALNLLLIPRFGALAAACTTVIAEGARALLARTYVRATAAGPAS